jgi:hypothetical protein
MKHLLKYTNATVGASLQRAFGSILSDMLYKKSEGFVALSGKERWNNLDFVCQSNPVLPCLFDLKNVDWTQSYTDVELELQYAEGNLPLNGSTTHTIDYYTLETKDLYNDVNDITKTVVTTELPIARICGGYVLGNFTDVLFPIYDPAQDNMITDVMGSCVASCLKGDFQSSYAYLRFGQMLMSFANENKDTLPQTDSNKRNFKPTLFKL